MTQDTSSVTSSEFQAHQLDRIVRNTERSAKNTHFIAVIIGIFAALTLIGMLIIGGEVVHATNVIDTPSPLCQSQGGTVPGC
jgi:hypothetical protein